MERKNPQIDSADFNLIPKEFTEKPNLLDLEFWLSLLEAIVERQEALKDGKTVINTEDSE